MSQSRMASAWWRWSWEGSRPCPTVSWGRFAHLPRCSAPADDTGRGRKVQTWHNTPALGLRTVGVLHTNYVFLLHTSYAIFWLADITSYVVNNAWQKIIRLFSLLYPLSAISKTDCGFFLWLGHNNIHVHTFAAFSFIWALHTTQNCLYPVQRSNCSKRSPFVISGSVNFSYTEPTYQQISLLPQLKEHSRNVWGSLIQRCSISFITIEHLTEVRLAANLRGQFVHERDEVYLDGVSLRCHVPLGHHLTSLVNLSPHAALRW